MVGCPSFYPPPCSFSAPRRKPRAPRSIPCGNGPTPRKTIPARLISATADAVSLKLRDGRVAEVKLDTLSEADRAYVADLRKTGQAMKAGTLPDETEIDKSVPVEGGPRVFLTPHFRFECDQGVTQGFIAEAARVFEGTLHAIDRLPIGLKPKPPEGMTRYESFFLSRESFEQKIGNSLPSIPGQYIAGVYIPKEKAILVPFSSIGAQENGSRKTLRRTSDTSTLIHEITHQVMHDWLGLTPMWLAEGMSEYMAAVPYQNGRFEFRNAERGLKETLGSKYRDEPVSMIHPADLIEATPAAWSGSLNEYRSAMLLTYYFVHLDRGGQGEALTAYFHFLEQGRTEADSFITEYNSAVADFEKKRVAYNEAVDTYNADLRQFKRAVDDYNSRIGEYNQQVRDGVPENRRVVVGAEPKAPTPPANWRCPKSSPRTPGAARWICSRSPTPRGAPLYRGIEGEQLGENVKAAFEAIGIKVTLEPMGDYPLKTRTRGIASPVPPGE